MIDNDINGIDFIIGFDIVLNMIIGLVDKIRDIVLSYVWIFIIEVMGCDCGDLVLWVGLLVGVEIIVVLEVKIDIKEIVDKIE